MKNLNKLSKQERLSNKWYIFKENNPSAFVFVMIIVINILFVFISSGLLLFLPENEGRTFFEMIRFAFTLMVNPSGRYVYSDYPISLVVTTVVVLLGMISLTGGTVGYITSIINNILEKSANSKNMLKLKNHIVILNYNHKVPSLICDYCFDDIDNTYITILSNKDKNEIKNQIDIMFSSNNIKKRFKNIIIREGNPMSTLDLESISLHSAKTVLIMSPENDDYNNISVDNQSFEISKLFMFITWYFSNIQNDMKTNIIVEANNLNVENMVKEYHLENINQISVPVNYNEVLGKILAIISIMPSLNDVLLHMFSFEGVEIYIEKIPENISIKDELSCQKTAMPLFNIGENRVYIAENEDEIFNVDYSNGYSLDKPLPKDKLVPYTRFEKSEIIIIGINSKLPYILESLDCFKCEYNNSNIHVILMDTIENKSILENYYSNPKYQNILNSKVDKPIIIEDIFNPTKSLDISILNNINSMLFLSDENTSSSHIDEKPLLFWSRLKDVNTNISQRDCIVEILDMQNKDIIEKRNKDQVIVSDRFLSCIYAQLGKNPLRLDAIKDIITFEGDNSSKNIDDVFKNECNLLSIKVKNFFKDYIGNLEFKSKRELILWIYEATKHEYLVIGCIKNNKDYLFSRTDNKNDDLDTSILLAKEENSPLKDGSNLIKLNPNDELIVLKLNEHD